MRMIRSLILGLALLPSLAQAQSTLVQGGAWTPGHVPQYLSTGNSQATVMDGGGAAGGALNATLSELGVTVRGQGAAPYANAGNGPSKTNLCDYDGPITGPNHYLCLSPNAQGGGLLVYGAQNGASVLPFNFIVNGTTYAFPFVTGGIVGPGVTTVGHVVTWNNLTGTLVADGGKGLPAGAIVGTTDSQVLTNKSLTAPIITSGTIDNVAIGGITPFTGAFTTLSASSTVSGAGFSTYLASPPAIGGTAAAAGTFTTLTATGNTTLQGTLTAASLSTVGAIAGSVCATAGGLILYEVGVNCEGVGSAGWGLNLSGSTFAISQTAPPYGFDMPINAGLSASFAASALTINLVAAAGTSPTATNPVLIPFRSTTLTTGVPNWTAITSAVSITIPSTATLGTSNSVPFRIWIFLAYNSGTPELGVATCSNATTIFPCASWETNRVTTTSIVGGSNLAGTLYAAAGVASDAVRIIGYCDFSSGLAVAGTWASSCTSLQLMGPGVKKPGDVIQTATGPSTATTATFTTTPKITSVTVSIAPTSAINLVKYYATVSAKLDTDTDTQGAQMYRAASQACTTAIGGVDRFQAGNANAGSTITFLGLDNPASTSTQVYVLCGGLSGTGGTGTIPFGANDGATEILEEIMGALEPANENGIRDAPLRLTG